MTSNPVRISILGLGRAGHFHLQSAGLSAEVTVAAVYDIQRDKTQEVADRVGCRAAATPEAALDAPDIDAVVVATPTNKHFGLVKQAIGAGKAVLTEKPLGSTLAQVDDSFLAAQQQGVPLFVGFQRRFDPSFAELTGAVKSGDIGRLQFVRSVSRDNPVPTAAYLAISGGIFHDCLVHDLDMVCQIVGDVPTHVSAFASSFIPEIEQLGDVDNVVATMAFPGGVMASMDINRKAVYGYDQRLEAFGDAGMVCADNQHQSTVRRAVTRGVLHSPIDYSFPTRYREAYRLELEAFVRCVRGEAEVPISHHDVRVNHLLACGLEQAARERRVIAFEEIEQHLDET